MPCRGVRSEGVSGELSVDCNDRSALIKYMLHDSRTRAAEKPMVDKQLLDILVCPWCLGELEHDRAHLRCTKCGAGYRIEDDIPRMLVEEADLNCGACHRLMEKRGTTAVCTSCGRHYRMDVRVSGSLLDHATQYCPKCNRELTKPTIGERESVCPRCGASYGS